MAENDLITDVIVVPLDGSPRADLAVRVATKLLPPGGELHLVSVGPDDRGYMQRHLDDTAATLTDVRVDTQIVAGWDPAPAVVAYADARSATICMTSHGRGTFRWAILGSVAEDVVAKAGRPAVIVGPHCDAEWGPAPGPVLLAYDGADLPDAVVDEACAAARRFDTGVLVVTVIHPLDIEGALTEAERFGAVERRISDRGCATEHRLEQRHFPAAVLADIARERESPAVVMAAHARKGVARVVVGSTTLGVVNLAPCPVIAVHV